MLVRHDHGSKMSLRDPIFIFVQEVGLLSFILFHFIFYLWFQAFNLTYLTFVNSLKSFSTVPYWTLQYGPLPSPSSLGRPGCCLGFYQSSLRLWLISHHRCLWIPHPPPPLSNHRTLIRDWKQLRIVNKFNLSLIVDALNSTSIRLLLVVRNSHAIAESSL